MDPRKGQEAERLLSWHRWDCNVLEELTTRTIDTNDDLSSSNHQSGQGKSGPTPFIMIPCLLSNVLSVTDGCNSYWVMTTWAFMSHVMWASVCVRMGTVVLTLIIMTLVKWSYSDSHCDLLRSLISHMRDWGSAQGYGEQRPVIPSWWQWYLFDHLPNFQQTENVPLSPSAQNLEGSRNYFQNGQIKKSQKSPPFIKN